MRENSCGFEKAAGLVERRVLGRRSCTRKKVVYSEEGRVLGRTLRAWVADSRPKSRFVFGKTNSREGIFARLAKITEKPIDKVCLYGYNKTYRAGMFKTSGAKRRDTCRDEYFMPLGKRITT